MPRLVVFGTEGDDASAWWSRLPCCAGFEDGTRCRIIPRLVNYPETRFHIKVQAADYQVQIRKKDQQQEKVRSEGGSDWTRYQIIVDGEPGPPLRKRQAVLTMIQKLIQKGVWIEAVSKMLPPSRLRASSPAIRRTRRRLRKLCGK